MKYIDPIFKAQFPYFNYMRRTVYKHPESNFTYREWHHGWLGISMITTGLIIDFISVWTGKSRWLGLVLITGGAWNYIDDRIQHSIQAKEIRESREIEVVMDQNVYGVRVEFRVPVKGTGYYQSMSFLHWAFDWVYPLKDNILGWFK